MTFFPSAQTTDTAAPGASVFQDSAPVRATPRLIKQQVDEMLDMRKSGASWPQIGHYFGCSQRYARKLVADMFGRVQPKRSVDMDKVRQMHAEGATYRELSDRFGKNPGTLFRWLEQDRRNKCQFTEQGAADRKKVANKLSTGSKAAANRLLSCESTGN